MITTVATFAKNYPDFRKRMESICVVDVGNAFTKTHSGIKFPSTVKEVFNLNEDNTDAYTTVVEYEGTTYRVGSQKAESMMDPNKYQSIDYKLLVLTAIVEHFNLMSEKQGKPAKTDLSVRLGLGLPAQYYTDHVDLLKNEFKRQEFSLTIDEKTYDIKIIDVQVFKQGGTLSRDDAENYDYPMLIVDFGGGTLDASYWDSVTTKRGTKEPRLTDSISDERYGFQQIMHELRTKLVSNTNSKLSIYNLIDYLEDNHVHFLSDDLFRALVEETLMPYANDVYRHLHNRFDIISTKQICLIGGPARLLVEYFKEMVPPTCEVKLMNESNPQFANVNLFFHKYAYAQMVFYTNTVLTKAPKE